MSAHLIEDSFADRMIAKSPDANADPRQHSFGRNTAGNCIEGDANTVAVARFGFDHAAIKMPFFFHDRHPELAEGRVSGGPGIFKIGDKGLAGFASVIGISRSPAGRGAGRNPKTARLADGPCPHEPDKYQAPTPAQITHPRAPWTGSDREVYRLPGGRQGHSDGALRLCLIRLIESGQSVPANFTQGVGRDGGAT